MVVQILLQDRLLRVAAASLAFNVGAWVLRGLVSLTKGGREEAVNGIRAEEAVGEWEVEPISAVVEALSGRKRAMTRVSYTFPVLAR